MDKSTKFIVEAGIIASMYASLTVGLGFLAYGEVQIRFAEALAILPFFTPAAIPGLFVGCFAANLIGPNGIIDAVIGSSATLIAAVITYYMPKRWLAPVPPIVVNALAVGWMLKVIYEYPLPLAAIMGYVAIGQTIACYLLGYPLLLLLQKNKNRMFG